jgi:O-antigen/teichoic acid export membrane protein
MRFGKWVFWLHIVSFVVLQLDTLVVGKVLGVVTLGFYQMATHLVGLPTTQIAFLVRGVMFPAFAKTHKPESRRQGLLHALALTSAAVIPVGCFITVFADHVVQLILGTQWLVISPLVRILTWAGVATALRGVTTPFCQAIGKADIPVYATLVQASLLALLLYPAVTGGNDIGVAWAVSTAAMVSLIYQFIRVGGLIQARPVDILNVFRIATVASSPFIGAAIMTSSSVESTLAVSVPPLIAAGCAVAASLAILAIEGRGLLNAWPKPMTAGQS